nr:MAG TPA: hypothetical protein [Caudoviricetes sp.]DAM39527.1 MAG TPA: hypothetical protein [Caudoviricetes sp.]
MKSQVQLHVHLLWKVPMLEPITKAYAWLCLFAQLLCYSVILVR